MVQSRDVRLPLDCFLAVLYQAKRSALGWPAGLLAVPATVDVRFQATGMRLSFVIPLHRNSANGCPILGNFALFTLSDYQPLIAGLKYQSFTTY